MDIWIIPDTEMANNLVKWWKNKFISGYKQFSDCGESKVSDTEVLLARLASEENVNEKFRPSCTTPPLRSQLHHPPGMPLSTEDASTPKRQLPQHHLNFEEFSCDVAVDNGAPNNSGAERREFSFTLYDFDGHGKITKDDITGLVSSIYEALGSSVTVPHYGSKTIQVKLTVSPDQSKHVSATIINGKGSKSEGPSKEGSDEGKRYCQSNSKQKRSKTHHCCDRRREQQPEKTLVSEESSDKCCQASDQNFTSEDEKILSDTERLKAKEFQKKRARGMDPRYTIRNVSIKDIYPEDAFPKMKTHKKRSSSLQRQELVEIIQANMDKNNLSFQTARKHSKHVSVDAGKKPRPRRTSRKITNSSLQYLANMVDPAHLYVDLGSLHNATHLPRTTPEYDKLFNAVMCVSNKNAENACRKSNDQCLPFQCQLLQYPMVNDENRAGKPHTGKKPSPKIQVAPPEVKPQPCKVPQIVTGHTSSPHHLKHRNRQEDQARAMSQVVTWLEQEFSSNLNTKQQKQEKTRTNHFAQSSHKEKTTSGTPSTQNSGTERHEHHHVHEHVHHHYHHYPDTPLVV